MSIKGFFIYAFIVAIISVLAINLKAYYLYAILLLILFLAYKKFDIVNCFLLIIISMFFSFYKKNEVYITNNYIESNVTIKSATNTYLIVNDNKINYLIYKDKNDINTYYQGNIIYVKGSIQEIENDLELDVFEFKDYLKYKRVFYQIIADEEIKIIDGKMPLNQKIINSLTKNLQNESYSMCKMLLFNDKNADIEAYNNLKEINAIHLFVVSGFHISFLFKLISLIFKKNKMLQNIIGSIISFVYVFILSFQLSALRALLSTFINKFFSKYLNTIDAVSISGLIILLIEPLNIFNYSFIMSFLMTYIVIISSHIIKNKNPLIKSLLISLLCFIAMIPIQLIINYKINVISLFTNIILTYVVMVIFTLCIFSICISKINGDCFSFIYKGFNQLVDKISNIDSSIVLGSLSLIPLIIFYGLFILLLISIERKNNKKTIFSGFSILLFFILLYNRHIFNYSQQVIFLNVYQGDCAIIMDSFNGKVMLIDTGGLTNYDIANKKIMPFLNYHGIRKIDKVVITHDDYDHCGALKSLNESIKINEIISDKSISNVVLGKINLYNLNKYYNETNNNNDTSIVLYGNICDKSFLFTGDISSTIEKKIITDNKLNVDFLKVAHHGSSTSSSSSFLKEIKATYAIISVGKNNKYHHPNNETLKRLNDNNIIIYRTDLNGSIRIRKKLFESYFIESAK